MTPEQVAKLQPGDKVKRVFCKGAGYVEITTHSYVRVRWVNHRYDILDKTSPLWLDMELPADGAK